MEQTIADFIDKYGIGLYIPREIERASCRERV